MPDPILLQSTTNLFGDDIAEAPSIDREPLASGLYAQLKDISLDEFVHYLTNRFEAMVSYANLCAGERDGQRISLLFNPHRLDTGTKRFPVSLYAALKDPGFVNGLARVVLLKKKQGLTKDLLYQSIGMGVQGTSYVQEFPPHVARDLALEYDLTKHSHVLDPCAGWGGRMLGFSAVVNSYTCCEPSTRTAEGLRQLLVFIKSFRSDFTATIHEAPFEDVVLHPATYDFALTSPPYYDTEQYAPGEVANSFNRYHTFQSWVDGFYAPLIHRTMAALKPGAAFVLNIGSRLYPLNDTLFTLAEGKYVVEKQKGRLSASNGLGKEGEGETFYEVRNPSGTIITVTKTEPSESISASQNNDPLPAVETQTSALAFALRQADAPDTTPETVPQTFNSEVFIAGLRSRGHQLLTHDGRLFASDSATLSDDDRATIKAHRDVLLTLATPWQDVPLAPVVSPPNSLAQFLGTAPLSNNWQPTEPISLDGVATLAFDTETTGLHWHKTDRPIGISLHTPDGRKQYLPWGHAGGNLDEAVVKRWAERELRNKHLVGANIKFDIHMMRAWGIDLEAQGCTVTDVQHYGALLDDTRKSVSLDNLAKDYLHEHKTGQDLDKSRMVSYHAGDVASYAEHDAGLTWRLREAMWPLLDKEDLHAVRALEDAVIFPVCEMEKNAARLDVPLLEQWCEETGYQCQRMIDDVAKEVGFAFSPDSSKDWERVFEHFGLPVTNFTGQGAPSFTDAILKEVSHPFVQMGRKAGKLASLRSKFLVAYRDWLDGDLLRFQLHQLRGEKYGTVRGRFSSSDKNIQQVMNADTQMTSFGSMDYFVRQLFIPNDGMLMFSADAAQIEFRLFVHYSDSERLLQAYRDDPTVSFHRIAEGMLKPFKSDMPYTKIKSMNFLFVYGGGKTHAAEYLELPQDVADQFCDIYHAAFPEVKALGRKVEQVARSRKYVKSLLGRRARFPDPDYAYKALNAVIQPSAADIFKQKTVEVYEARKELGLVLRAPIHDELLMDVPDEEMGRRVTEILNRQSFELKVQILWKGKTGKNWSECK